MNILFSKMQTFMFLVFTSFYFTNGDWVDPHSMDTNFKNKLPNSSERVSRQGPKEPVTTKNHCDSDIHLRRIVRLILNNAYLDNEVGYHEGYLNIKLSSEEHKLLVNFAESTSVEEKIFHEISSIFESAFQKPSLDRYEEIILSMQEKLFDLIFNPTSASLFAACLSLFIIYKLVMAQFTWKSIIVYFASILYIADFVITYLHIIQDEEIDSMVHIKQLGTAPPECDPQKMSWWKYTKTRFESTFFENPCKVYYQATFQNYKYFVAPSKILIRQFRTLILGPVGDLGEAFGKFGRGMFTNLPWGLNVVLFPIMLIAALITVFIIFLFITKPTFKLSLFHLFTIELGQRDKIERPPVPRVGNRSNRMELEYPQNNARCRRNGNNGREVGFDTNHRKLVQEVTNDNSSRHGEKPTGTDKKADQTKDEQPLKQIDQSGSKEQISNKKQKIKSM